MSMYAHYDNFQAPQFVDFMNLQKDDASDASAFFARDHENTLLDHSRRDSSMSSASSDGESTLTPTCSGSVMNDSVSSDDSMTMSAGALHSEDAQNTSIARSPLICSTPVTATTKCVNFDGGISVSLKQAAVSKGGKFEDSAMCVDGAEQSCITEPPILSCSRLVRKSGQLYSHTDVPHSMNSSMSKRSPHLYAPMIKIIPPTPSSSSNASSRKSTPYSPKVPPASYTGRNSVVDNNRRRSRSAGSMHQRSPCVLDNNQILQEALESLTLSNEQAQSKCHNTSADETMTTVGGKCSEPTMNSSQRRVHGINKSVRLSGREESPRPKRKLSPPPPNERDYSAPPVKYVSVAEHIARIQNKVPARFRTLPTTATSSKRIEALKKAQKPKFGCSEMTPRFCRDQQSCDVSDQTVGKDVVKTVKVPRWPAPKVEPFKLVEYKKKELPKTVFRFDKRTDVLLSNRKTPLKYIKKPTKIEPFSFDPKTQEIVQRKLNRCNGVIDSHCSSNATRRRSKSMGAERTSSKLIHHARPATVLHKPAFVPVKPHHKIIPLDIELCTARRAREREQFETHLRLKEQERTEALNKFREDQKKAEEENLRKMRQEKVHKARPMPAYRNFKPAPCRDALTEPLSPKVLKRHIKSNSHTNKFL